MQVLRMILFFGSAKRVAALAIALAAYATEPSAAMTDKQHALSGKAAWYGFTCSILADKLGMPDERDRLFIYGYNKAYAFFERFETGQVSIDELRKHLPWGIFETLPGVVFRRAVPGSGIDFYVGRVFQVVSAHVRDKIEQFPDVTAERSMEFVRTAFSSHHCKDVEVNER